MSAFPIAAARTLVHLLALALLAMAAALPVVAHAANSFQSEPFIDQVARAAWWGDYDELQRLYDLARRSTERSSTGERQIEAFRRGYARIFNGGVLSGEKNNDAYYTQLDALTRQWAAAHPDSSMAHDLHARALYAHAWFFRGSGYANQVTPQGRAEFNRYLTLAEDHLAAHSAVVMKDSTTHLYLVMIERAAGRSFDAQWAIEQDSLRVDPDDEAIIIELVTSALPKWGGNADQLERLARDALTRTQAKRGFEMYTRVYATAAYEYKSSLFQDTWVDWPTMQQGYRDMLTRYPDADNLNRFAFMACLAQDKATTVELLDRIADKPTLYPWGGSDGTRNYEGCKRWARTP